jgi:hypothetical protein
MRQGTVRKAGGGQAACALCALAVAALAGPPRAAAADFTAIINANPIEGFRIGSDERHFGALTFVGGFTMTSRTRDFGALSSFRFLDGTGTRLAMVADTGHFITGELQRDAAFNPVGLGPLDFTVLPGMDGRVSSAKWETDAESLLVEAGSVVIGFERFHQLARFAFDGNALGAQQESLDFLIPQRELRSNRGFETLAQSPADGPLRGAIVAVSEKSIDKEGNIFAAILSGPMQGVFTIARSDEFDITDGDFLPDGDLVILERSYQMAKGVRMRLKRIDASALKPGATVDGDIMLEADMRYQIDNMEGLDIWQAPDGTTRLSLVSDDNKSILQRNLYLEFALGK